MGIRGITARTEQISSRITMARIMPGRIRADTARTEPNRRRAITARAEQINSSPITARTAIMDRRDKATEEIRADTAGRAIRNMVRIITAVKTITAVRIHTAGRIIRNMDRKTMAVKIILHMDIRIWRAAARLWTIRAGR